MRVSLSEGPQVSLASAVAAGSVEVRFSSRLPELEPQSPYREVRITIVLELVLAAVRVKLEPVCHKFCIIP